MNVNDMLNSFGNNTELEYDNNGESKTISSIYTGNHEEIRIYGGGHLIIEAAPIQPCIGPETNDGMSYGRWEPDEYNKLKKIVIDGVRVELRPCEEAFSIGGYNFKEYPTVELVNGGELINCPELTGERILVKIAYPPDGSTKICERPIYKIIKPGTDLSEYLSVDQKNLITYLKSVNRNDLAELVNMKTSNYAINRTRDLLSINPNANIGPLIDGKHDRHLFMVECACVLDIDVSQSALSEFMFEGYKYDTLRERYERFDTYPDKEDYNKVICTIAHGMYDNRDWQDLTEWEQKVVYEMIPSYCFNFNNYPSKNEAARAFYECTL
jgi:hypothetical protein